MDTNGLKKVGVEETVVTDTDSACRKNGNVYIAKYTSHDSRE